MSPEIAEKVIQIIADNQKIPPEQVHLDSTFEELGIDSLDGISIVFAIEGEFNINIPDDDAQSMRSVRQVVERLSGLLETSKAGN